jgi:hypothetical protein
LLRDTTAHAYFYCWPGIFTFTAEHVVPLLRRTSDRSPMEAQLAMLHCMAVVCTAQVRNALTHYHFAFAQSNS